MRALIALSVLILMSQVGCASYTAQKYLYEARSIHRTALHETNPELQRIIYELSCESYLNAYYARYQQFRLTQIRDAVHSCMAGQELEIAATFMDFRDRYMKRNPYEIMHSQPEWLKHRGN